MDGSTIALGVISFGILALALVSRRMRPIMQIEHEDTFNDQWVKRRVDLIVQRMRGAKDASEDSVLSLDAYRYFEEDLKATDDFGRGLLSFDDAHFILSELVKRDLAENSEIRRLEDRKAEWLAETIERRLKDLRQTPDADRRQSAFVSETAYLIGNCLEFLNHCGEEAARRRLRRIWSAIKGLAQSSEFNRAFARAAEADLAFDAEMGGCYTAALNELPKEVRIERPIPKILTDIINGRMKTVVKKRAA